jgi:cell division protein FtsN
MLDSIRQSIAMSEHDEEQPAAAANDRAGYDEDFGLFDSDKPDFSDFGEPDTTSDTTSEVGWGFDDAADALPVPDAPARKRSPALMIILIVVLCAVGGYYAVSLTSDNAGRDEGRTVRTVMPLADLQVDAPQSAQLVSQKPASEKPAETAVSPALAKPEALTAAAPVAVEADAPVKSKSASAEAIKPAETPAPVEPETLPVSVPVAVEKPAPEQSKSASAEAIKPAETPASVEPETLPASVPAAVGKPEIEQSNPVPAEVVKPAASAAPVRAPFFTVHVGSYRTKAAASAEAERIKAKGHDAFVERADLGRRGTWYRVKVGRFKIRADAEQLRKKIHNVLVQDSMVVTNRTD